MRSPATRSSACSASKRRTSTERIRVAPGSNTPLSMPEMWAMGAGIRTASSAPSPCTCAMSEAFQLSPRCVCSTALGTPVEPEVKRTRATSEGRVALGAAATGGPPSTSSSAAGSDRASVPSSTTSRGSTWANALSTSAAPNECSTGAATAPNRQQARVSTAAARLLGTCQATVSPRRTPRARRPPATEATRPSTWTAESRVGPSTTSPPPPRRHRHHDHRRPRSRAARRAWAPAKGRRDAGSGGPASAPTWHGGGPSSARTLSRHPTNVSSMQGSRWPWIWR